MTTTPPGWYDDGHGALRWWDGSQWTEHVAQPDPEPSEAPTEAEIVAAQERLEEPDAGGAGWPVAGGEQAFPPAGAAEEPESPAYAAAYHTGPGQQGYSPAAYAPAGFAQGAYTAAPYPDAPAAGGAFVAATQPRKSKLWIVWVVLGVVLLGVVIAATVLIPLLILSASAGGAAGQSADERAAVATVEQYDSAWQDADCEGFTAATSDGFRLGNGYSDCAVFEADAEAFDENFDDYVVTVTAVETQGDQIAVTTRETYTAFIDEDGEPADASPGSTVYHYTLVAADGGWVIDDLVYE